MMMMRLISILYIFLLTSIDSSAALSLRRHRTYGDGKTSLVDGVLSKFKRESRDLVENAQTEAAETLSSLLPISADQVLEMEDGEEEVDEEAYPVDPEQQHEGGEQETDSKYLQAMAILKGIASSADSNFSTSSVLPPTILPADTMGSTQQSMDSNQMTMMNQMMPPQGIMPLQLPGSLPGSSVPDPLLQALQQQQQLQEQEVEEAGGEGEMANPAMLEQKYMEALAQAQAQERLNAQERALSERVRQQHEAAMARAKYDHQMVDYLKNMTAQWELQANASEAAANKTQEMMMEINGAQVARKKLEQAAEEEISAQREHAMRTAEVKQYEDALTQLKELEKNATSRKENASTTLEEAFELFQKNSNQTAGAAIAKAGGSSSALLSQIGGPSSSGGLPQLPPGISPPPGISSSSSSSIMQPQPVFARLVPPPIGNVAMGSDSDSQGDGVSNPLSSISNAMEKAGFPMIESGSSSSKEEVDEEETGE